MTNHETCRTDRSGKCIGYHCPNCDAPTSYQGHHCNAYWDNRTVGGGTGIHLHDRSNRIRRIVGWFR